MGCYCGWIERYSRVGKGATPKGSEENSCWSDWLLWGLWLLCQGRVRNPASIPAVPTWQIVSIVRSINLSIPTDRQQNAVVTTTGGERCHNSIFVSIRFVYVALPTEDNFPHILHINLMDVHLLSSENSIVVVLICFLYWNVFFSWLQLVLNFCCNFLLLFYRRNQTSRIFVSPFQGKSPCLSLLCRYELSDHFHPFWYTRTHFTYQNEKIFWKIIYKISMNTQSNKKSITIQAALLNSYALNK